MNSRRKGRERGRRVGDKKIYIRVRSEGVYVGVRPEIK